MLTLLAGLVGVVSAAVVALLTVFLVGMRAKWPPVVDTVRRINRTYLNPRQMQTAGSVGAFAQILRHRGRKSGVTHQTPLGIEPTEDGFVILMVYGERTQWVRNVLAAGSATVVVEGEAYEVDRPAVVPIADVIGYLKESDRRMAGLLGMKSCLRLYHADHD